MARLVLSGYYGFNNIGDDAILYTMIRTLKEIEPTLEITVFAQTPEKLRRQYQEEGIKIVNRWSIPEILRAILRCDLFISGGGSLLQDVSSSNGILYYLGLIWLARFLDKPVMIYAQGVGPVVKPRNKRLVSWILNGVNKITVRDQESKEDLVALGVQQEITVTADPVFCLYKHKFNAQDGLDILTRYGLFEEGGGIKNSFREGNISDGDATGAQEGSDVGEAFVPLAGEGDTVVGSPCVGGDTPIGEGNELGTEKDGAEKMPPGKLLGVYLRPWQNNEFLPALVEALRGLAEKGWRPVFVPMQFPVDITIAREAAELLQDYNPVVLKEKYSPMELLSLTSQFDLLLGMRLHSLIMAAVTGVPLVGLSYDHKVDRFLRQAGQVALFSTNNLNAQRLTEMLLWTDEKREDLRKEMEARMQVMYQKGWQTARIAMSVLEARGGKGGGGR